MEKLLCPSMMCANFEALKDETIALDKAGTDIFHCDIMDGSFVPNMTMGVPDVTAIRKNTGKLVDCHLMVDNPSEKVQLFIDAGADIIYIHPKTEKLVNRTLSVIKEAGRMAGIAIDPDTSIESVYETFNLVDYVLVMTVNPGFAGQKYNEFVTDKIIRLIPYKEKYGFKIIIDGACSPAKIEELSKLGADGFVLGTSAVFGKEEDYDTIFEKLRQL